MNALLLKKGLIASLIFLGSFLVFQNINIKSSDRIQLASTTAAFESIETDFTAINTKVDSEFSQLPKHEKPSKDQPIKDALEFIKFSKNTFTDTMGQNSELLAEIKDFDKNVNEVLK